MTFAITAHVTCSWVLGRENDTARLPISVANLLYSSHNSFVVSDTRLWQKIKENHSYLTLSTITLIFDRYFSMYVSFGPGNGITMWQSTAIWQHCFQYLNTREIRSKVKRSSGITQDTQPLVHHVNRLFSTRS